MPTPLNPCLRTRRPPSNRHGTMRRLLLIGLLALPLRIAAQESPDCSPPLPLASASREQALPVVERMLKVVHVCQKDALFLAALGQLLNMLGRYLEAADHLERALMLDADLKDAQLSYAIALAAIGDTRSAVALIDSLLADPALPADLRQHIERRKATLTAVAAPAAWQRRISLATRIGYDSNLLGSPNLGNLALTLAGQTLILPLDVSYLARSGTFARADAQLDLHHAAPGGGRWDMVSSLRSRASPSVRKADSNQIEFLVERSQNMPASLPAGSARQAGAYINASALALSANSGTRYDALGLAGGLGLAWRLPFAAECRSRWGAEITERRYSDNQVLSGRYRGTTFFSACEASSGVQSLLGFKAGHDTPVDPDRAGGAQRQFSLRLATYLPMAVLGASARWAWLGTSRAGVLLDFERSHQTDSTGYSPILNDGGIRIVARQATRLEYQHPFSASLRGVLGAERVAQTSTLALFKLDSWGLHTGLRLVW